MSKRRLTAIHSEKTPPGPRRLAWWFVAPCALAVGALLRASGQDPRAAPRHKPEAPAREGSSPRWRFGLVWFCPLALTALAFIGCEAKSQDEAEPGSVCGLFVERKNAGDPKADDLLGPVPAVPDHPVSRADADRLETDFFLRQNLTIDHVRHGKSPGQLVLVAKGNVAAPRLEIQDGASLDSEQRTMSNPDLTVEVRDGRIVGVEARLHAGK